MLRLIQADPNQHFHIASDFEEGGGVGEVTFFVQVGEQRDNARISTRALLPGEDGELHRCLRGSKIGERRRRALNGGCVMFCPNPDCPNRQETGHAAEFREGIVRCSDCDTPLVPQDPDTARHQAENSRHIELVELDEISEPAYAALACSLLDEAGIRYEIEGAGVQDFFALGRLGTGFSPVTGPPKLRVDAARLEEARRLLESLDESPADRADGSDVPER